jgi:hypothetical protein
VPCRRSASTVEGGGRESERQADSKAGTFGAGDEYVFIVRTGALARRGLVVGRCMGRMGRSAKNMRVLWKARSRYRPCVALTGCLLLRRSNWSTVDETTM